MKKDIFIVNDGRLSRKNDTLYYQSEKGSKYIPINGIDSIHVFSEMDLNKRLLEFLTSMNISVHFYNYYGYYIGSYYPREYLNSGYVLLKQCEAYSDMRRRRILAGKFVSGACANILQVLKYYDRREADLNWDISDIEELIGSLSSQQSIESLMAIEGNIRQKYYQCFNKIIKNRDFAFTVRSKRPPRDKINALISFGNSILYTTVLSQIYHTQMDPRIGYLHSTNSRRFSLNLDIAEIFKPIIVDRAIFSLLNKSVLSGKDFINEMGGLLLKDAARQKFIAEINDKLETTIKHPGLSRRISYKGLIRAEVYKIQKCLTEGEDYIPFLAKW